jgi:hypothetical protein
VCSTWRDECEEDDVSPNVSHPTALDAVAEGYAKQRGEDRGRAPPRSKYSRVQQRMRPRAKPDPRETLVDT